MNQQLIFDVGMHVGRDTEFYLRKGFRVVAIEADPRLAARTAERLSKYVCEGRLTILNIAINTHDGQANFYANQDHNDWGTLSSQFVDRNATVYGLKHDAIQVACRRFAGVLKEYGVPYYLKVDIEGLDILCLQGLLEIDERPTYISIEPDQLSFEGAFSELALLWHLGYRRFKIVNQALHHKVRCPIPPREGEAVEWDFDGLSSGLFGDELSGDWLTIDQTLDQYRLILKYQALFGHEGGWKGKWRGTVAHRFYNLWSRLTSREPLGWYDIHAKLGEL